MQIDEFGKLVKARRAIRRFKPDPIPDEYVQKILEVARWAPSGANSQPWDFIVIKDRDTKIKIEELYNTVETSKVWEMTRREDLRHWAAVWGRVQIADAPVVLVPIGDVRGTYASVVTMHFMYQSRNLENMTNVTLLIHLAAASLGLGARWVSLSEPLMEDMKTLLGIPRVYQIFSIVPIGYPAHEPAPAYRRELSEMVHYDKYDMSKYRSDEKFLEYVAELRKLTRRGYIREPKP